MSKEKPGFKARFIKPLASIKLAVIIIILIAVITAIGTFVEAKYDAYAAKKLVYGTLWMYGVMLLLAVNLIAVMIDRWPWKVRHLPFLAAHVGIIFLLVGSYITSEFGLDGNMSVNISGKNNFVTSPETDLVVYATFDGDRYTKVFEQEVDFFLKPPSEKKTFEIPTQGAPIKIINYEKYAVPVKKVVESVEARHGSAVRFQLKNNRINQMEWLIQRRPEDPAKIELGKAEVHLVGDLKKIERDLAKNQIFLKVTEKGLDYILFHNEQAKPFAQGTLKESELIKTGWMDLDFKVVRYHQKAQEMWDIQPREVPVQQVTVPAILVEFQGQKNWVLLNDIVKLFSENGAYLLAFQNRKIDLGFQINLDRFDITHYQGTMKAMQYKSIVSGPDFKDYEISMNEPLKYQGYTFYQASFQEDPNTGKPTASVFSVNSDPGRALKYLGSLIMSLGIVLLFWFKRSFLKSSNAKAGGS